MRGRVPVVFAQTRNPPARRPAAIKRVTPDLPRVPLTWMRIGIECNARRCHHVSAAPSALRSAAPAARANVPSMRTSVSIQLGPASEPAYP